MPDVIHQIRIAVPAARVFEALSEEAWLRKWWTPTAKAHPKAGTVSTFTFWEGKVVFRMRIDRLDRDHIHWTCLGDWPEWGGTEVDFRLEEDDGETILRFRHSKWASADGELGACSLQWAKLFLGLKAELETGKGADPIRT